MTGLGRAELPCRADPDRWFDRRHRTHALAGCLTCPARSACARQALRGASWGMWAGIWIENNLDAVAHYLQAIAEMPPTGTTTAATPCAPTPAASLRQSPPASPGSAWRPAAPTRSPAATVLARCCGHCEVMAPGCRLSFDVVMRRIPAERQHDDQDASAVYAACGRCSGCVSGLDDRVAARLGYLVEVGRPAAAVAFYWRQTHWMLLRPAGGLYDTGAAA